MVGDDTSKSHIIRRYTVILMGRPYWIIPVLFSICLSEFISSSLHSLLAISTSCFIMIIIPVIVYPLWSANIPISPIILCLYILLHVEIIIYIYYIYICMYTWYKDLSNMTHVFFANPIMIRLHPHMSSITRWVPQLFIYWFISSMTYSHYCHIPKVVGVINPPT